MSLAAKIRRAPLRLVTGAYIVNSGLSKLKGVDDQTAAGMHGLATGTYPFFGKVDPKQFVKGLGAGEVAIGALLLAPIVPAGLAGIALTGFAGGLIGMYLKTPGLTQDGSVAPTQDGIAMSKDVFMAGIGVALILDAALQESPITDDKHRVHDALEILPGVG